MIGQADAARDQVYAERPSQHCLSGDRQRATFLATFDGPGRPIDCALAADEEIARLGIEIRAGLHTGEIELMGSGDVGGIGVHIAARVLENAQPSQVWTSRTVKDLVVGSKFRFSERGTYHLEGVEGDWPLFAVEA
jgi:class 3 adenylate cyclase